MLNNEMINSTIDLSNTRLDDLKTIVSEREKQIYDENDTKIKETKQTIKIVVEELKSKKRALEFSKVTNAPQDKITKLEEEFHQILVRLSELETQILSYERNKLELKKQIRDLTIKRLESASEEELSGLFNKKKFLLEFTLESLIKELKEINSYYGILNGRVLPNNEDKNLKDEYQAKIDDIEQKIIEGSIDMSENIRQEVLELRTKIEELNTPKVEVNTNSQSIIETLQKRLDNIKEKIKEVNLSLKAISYGNLEEFRRSLISDYTISPIETNYVQMFKKFIEKKITCLENDNYQENESALLSLDKLLSQIKQPTVELGITTRDLDGNLYDKSILSLSKLSSLIKDVNAILLIGQKEAHDFNTDTTREKYIKEVVANKGLFNYPFNEQLWVEYFNLSRLNSDKLEEIKKISVLIGNDSNSEYLEKYKELVQELYEDILINYLVLSNQVMVQCSDYATKEAYNLYLNKYLEIQSSYLKQTESDLKYLADVETKQNAQLNNLYQEIDELMSSIGVGMANNDEVKEEQVVAKLDVNDDFASVETPVLEQHPLEVTPMEEVPTDINQFDQGDSVLTEPSYVEPAGIDMEIPAVMDEKAVTTIAEGNDEVAVSFVAPNIPLSEVQPMPNEIVNQELSQEVPQVVTTVEQPYSEVTSTMTDTQDIQSAVVSDNEVKGPIVEIPSFDIDTQNLNTPFFVTDSTPAEVTAISSPNPNLQQTLNPNQNQGLNL